mmetsp:Transcript_18956/g.26677  ORF Transcript_18956/g.26677 Transcript_18956/m.26677 type:complete len:89 (+) Transcript_18956:199-465(+)
MRCTDKPLSRPIKIIELVNIRWLAPPFMSARTDSHARLEGRTRSAALFHVQLSIQRLFIEREAVGLNHAMTRILRLVALEYLAGNNCC